ncbi:MAG: iron-containing alcohol dehydrogenase [Sphaerochaeta sp.]
MLNFRYSLPTQIIFGKDTQLSVGEEIKKRGGTRVLVHFGSGNQWVLPLLNQTYKSLEETGISYVSVGGVVPNPRLSLIQKGIQIGKAENVDFILAVGGGSVIDSAKGIGYGLVNEGNVWDFYIRKRKPQGCLPIGVVLTLAGTGSETSDGSVITNEDGWLKRDVGSNFARPSFAIMNPELTYSLPNYQTACGASDIIIHAMERYFTQVENVELSDRLCESVMKTIIHHLPISLREPKNYNSRAEIMWTATVCHNGLLTCGRKGDWASHNIEHELGGMFDVAHGAGLCAIWGSWARYCYSANIMRFAQFAVNVMGCTMDFQNPETTALEGINAVENFFKSVGMPTSIKELGIDLKATDIEVLADKCSDYGNRTIGAFKILSRDDIKAIYTMAK